jgi:hypothetical protein
MIVNYTGLVFGALLLSMCSTTYGITCPDLAGYDRGFLERAEATLDEASPEVQRLVNDYGSLRAAIRHCEKRRDANR